MDDDVRKVNIRGCARCGKDHAAVKFHPFKYNPIREANGIEFTHYGWCPETSEPIIMRIVDVPDAKQPGLQSR